MSNLSGYNNGYDQSYADGGINRPMEGYDTLIRFIDRFPLRIVIVLIGFSLLLRLAAWSDTLSSGEAMMNASFAYIIGFFVTLAEAVWGRLTRLIKDLLIRAVMIAEENSSQL